MIFQYTIDKVIDGSKTETRRVVDPGDMYCMGVMTHNGKAKWRTGHTYSVQPGLGKKGVARIRIKWIRSEPLRYITDYGARVEGVANRAEFRKLWNSIQEPGRKFEDDPFVWVIQFELVKEGN